ncbi:MAG: hypothetical protein R3C32_11335 [Chloroflexota bacterium]
MCIAGASRAGSTPWQIALAAAPSSSIDLVLTDLDRQPIARADVDAAGHAALEDLGLPTGAYLVWVEGRATADPTP